MKSMFRLVCSLLPLAVAGLLVPTTASAVVFNFTTDPFEGSTALTDPGRQVVGGEDVVDFNIAADVFSFNPSVFAIGGAIHFASGLVEGLPSSGVNTIALLSFDSDADPATPFGAGTAANLIANQITTPGAGFFIYFNQGLDFPRLVYSTDLSDNTADLKILARMTNLNGQSGRDAMATFTTANFQVANADSVPEPASAFTLVLAAAGLLAGGRVFRRPLAVV